MREVKKKGLSPVVASALLIMLVLLLALIIFLWARGFISERIEKFGRPIGELCKSVDFRANLIRDSGGDDTLEIVNRGNVNINSIEIRVSKGGNSEVQEYDFLINSGKSLSKNVHLRMKDKTYPTKIEILPVLVGNVKGGTVNKPFVCIDVGEVVYLDS
jgi:flagellin-like protein